MKTLLKVLIFLSGLYCLLHVIFDLKFNAAINLVTNIITAVFFGVSFLYVSLNWKGNEDEY
ncbi:hypothetical protein ACQCVB_02215 [Fictibacillus phosphorivorans]|uniref:hypothetical protein n=1 Tax=Fictibacillus phosphorivorans TaxID=1221500 RepID=UPI003CECE6AB